MLGLLIQLYLERSADPQLPFEAVIDFAPFAGVSD
jgi:hypothetical protein